MDELVVVEALAQIDRMLTKCRKRSIIETGAVVDDLLDLRGVLAMAAPAVPEP